MLVYGVSGFSFFLISLFFEARANNAGIIMAIKKPTKPEKDTIVSKLLQIIVTRNGGLDASNLNKIRSSFFFNFLVMNGKYMLLFLNVVIMLFPSVIAFKGYADATSKAGNKTTK